MGLGLAKEVFQEHGVWETGRRDINEMFKCETRLAVFASLP